MKKIDIEIVDDFVSPSYLRALQDACGAECPWFIQTSQSLSDYARDNPIREDIAESYLPYLAIRYRSDRISESLKKTIEDAIPNRIKYFDEQNFNMYPIN